MSFTLVIPDDAREVRCGSKTFEGCGQPIYWVPYKDKKHPTNPDGTSHFDTCSKMTRKGPRVGPPEPARVSAVMPGVVVNAVKYAIASGYPCDGELKQMMPVEAVRELRKLGYEV